MKNEAESTFKVMRIYPRDKDGVVDYEKNYTTERIDPTKPFPKGTFVIGSDYAIEDQNGSLKFLNKVRLYKDKEYCEFSGQKQYEKTEILFGVDKKLTVVITNRAASLT